VLFHNATGGGNTAIGFHALFNNNGSSNIGLGLNAGANLTIGSNNIDIGNLEQGANPTPFVLGRHK
jgi:hypothetical protein